MPLKTTLAIDNAACGIWIGEDVPVGRPDPFFFWRNITVPEPYQAGDCPRVWDPNPLHGAFNLLQPDVRYHTDVSGNLITGP